MGAAMKTFKVGVLGVGDISDVYIENLKKYAIVDVVGCAGRDPERVRRKARRHGIPRAYATVDDLFSDRDIDIVLNLTAPAVHASLTLAALCAGKHVYSEKPLAVTFEEGREIIEVAKQQGRQLGCAPDTILGGRLQTCRQLIDDGGVGQVLAASAFAVSRGPEWFRPNPEFLYRRGGGPLLDIGPYYLSALVSLLGPIRRCSAMARKSGSQRVVESGPQQGKVLKVEEPTHVTANLEFVSGAVATLITSYDVWDSELPRLELYGDGGTICLNDIDPCDGPNLFGGRVLLRTRRNYRWQHLPRADAALSEWEEVPIVHPFNETSHRENSRAIGLVDMAYAIAEHREPRVNAQMALHALEAMHGILRSGESLAAYAMETTCSRLAPLPVDSLWEGV
jgi:Predicted dehydrogenases and related proteins